MSLTGEVLIWASPATLIFAPFQELAGLGPQGMKSGPEPCLGSWPGVWLSTTMQTHLLSHADLLEFGERFQCRHASVYSVCLSLLSLASAVCPSRPGSVISFYLPHPHLRLDVLPLAPTKPHATDPGCHSACGEEGLGPSAWHSVAALAEFT